MTTTQCPPCSVEAERAVLGSILKGSLEQALEVLKDPSDFYTPKHQMIFRAALDLYAKSEPVDIVTVCDRVDLDKIGGRSYVVELADQYVSASNVKAYATTVVEHAMRRRLLAATDRIAQSCHSDMDIKDVLDQAQGEVFKIAEGRGDSEVQSVKEVMTAALEAINDYQSGVMQERGVQTGFPDLDDLLVVLENGDLTVIAGQTSAGKTQFALQVVQNVALQQKRGVLVFSLEMLNHKIGIRMLCSEARVDKGRVRRKGLLTDSEWQDLALAEHKYKDASIWFWDKSACSILDLRVIARRYKAQHNISLLVVDYLQLMRSGLKSETRQQEVTQISRGLKALAKELDLPVIALSQLNRQADQTRSPRLSQIRESGAIEQDADNVLFVLHDRDTKKSKIKIGKLREDARGTIDMAFIRGRWASITKREYDEQRAETGDCTIL